MKAYLIKLTFLAGIIGALGGCRNADIADVETPTLEHCTVMESGTHYLALIYPERTSHPMIEDSFLLAIENINTQGGLLGKPMGAITCDSQADPSITAQIIAELITVTQLGAIIGPALDQIALDAMDRIQAGNKVFISHQATSPALSTANDGGNFFRVVVSDALVSGVQAAVLNHKEITEVVLVYPTNTFGEGCKNAFLPNYEGTVITHPFDPQDELFAVKAMDTILNAGIENVYLIGNMDQTEALWTQAEIVGFQGFWILTNYQGRFVLADLGDAFENARGLAPVSYEDSPANTLLQELAQTGGLPEVDPHTFDAATVAAIAMGLSHSPENDQSIKHNLANNTSNGNVVYSTQWDRVLEELSAGKLDYEGASGNIKFDANGDVYTVFREWEYKMGHIFNGNCWSYTGDPATCL